MEYTTAIRKQSAPDIIYFRDTQSWTDENMPSGRPSLWSTVAVLATIANLSVRTSDMLNAVPKPLNSIFSNIV